MYRLYQIIYFIFALLVLWYVFKQWSPNLYEKVKSKRIEKWFLAFEWLFEKEISLKKAVEKRKEFDLKTAIDLANKEFEDQGKYGSDLLNYTIEEKGREFENYIIEKFNPKYFSYLDWSGDKYHKGRYALSSLNPDLKLGFRKKGMNRTFKFHVECKYRGGFYKNQLEFKEQQIKRYKKFASISREKVFVAIGVGGPPNSPNEVYIVPLKEMKSHIVRRDELSQFKRKYPQKELFLNLKEYSLT